MIWVSLGVVFVMVLFGYLRWRSMAPLFADAHLAEVAAALPDLKRRALAQARVAGAEPGASFSFARSTQKIDGL